MRTSLLVLSALVLAATAQAQSWNAATSFTTSTNSLVDGVWSYGISNDASYLYFSSPGTPTTDFHLMSVHDLSGINGRWYDQQGFALPVIAGTTDGMSNTLFLSGLPGGTSARLRFTAPDAGLYKIHAGFTGLAAADYGGYAVSQAQYAYVLKNGVSAYRATYATGTSDATVLTLSLAAGDTIDYFMGIGLNGSYYTSPQSLVDARIEAVPEPASLATFALGAVALVRRRSTHR